MNILQVIPYFNPGFGGDINVCTTLSVELVKRNHEVTIITTDFNFDAQYAGTIQEKGVRVIQFPCIARFGLFLYTPSIKKWLEENIRDFDIIHLHQFRSYQNIAVCSIAERSGIPYILQAHGSVLPFFEKQRLKKFFDLFRGYKILQNASKVVALSDAEAQQYLTMGVPENKIQVIPNGLDLSQFSDLPERGAFRSKYGIPADEKILLFLGRIHKIKGIDLLINAYADLVREDGDVRLVIAGPDDNYLSTITDQINRLSLPVKPLFTGPLYGRDKLSAFVDADIFVIASRYEAFPMTLLEAMACGTPVIVSENVRCEKLIGNPGWVSIVKFDDTRNFTCQARKILRDPVNSRKAALDGQRYIRSNFGWDRIIHHVERLYAGVVGTV